MRRSVNCDIGSGNLASATVEEHAASRKLRALSTLGNLGVNQSSPGFVPLGRTAVANCDEADGNTCQTYGSDYGWCNYPQYKCMAKYVEATDKKYSNIQTSSDPSATGFVFTHWIDNNSSLPQSTTVAYQESTEASATLTLSTTVDVGLSLSVKAGVPDVMSTTFTESFDFSLTSTDSHTVTTRQGWSVTQPVEVPAMTTIKAQLIIQKVSVTGDWSAVASFPDYAKMWCSNRVNGHYEWFVPAQNWLPQAYPSDCSGNTCNLRGSFEGWHGVSSSTTFTECPLGSRSC